jgi:hypothetical protein
MRLRTVLLSVVVALLGGAVAVPPALAGAPSEAKLEVNENCVENDWPCWAAPGSGSKPQPASKVTIAVGGTVMFTDAANTKVNIAWLGTAPTCSPGVPVSPASPESGWEGTCNFEEAGTYKFESATLFNDGVENFTKYEIVVGEGTQTEPPEFGRCQAVAREMVDKKTVYHGAYTNSGCTKASSDADGKFEWHPGVAKTHFTTATKSGMKVLFETVKGMKVTCTGETSSGEYVGPKLEENVVFRFTGCDFSERHGYSKMATYPASSAGAAEGEIVSDPTECELGVVKKGRMPANDKVALTCAEEDEFMWIKWKVPSYLGQLEAELCLKGWWFFTLKANSMSMSTTLDSKQSKGQQEWEKFETGPPEPLESTLNGGAFEHAGLADKTVQTSEEPVEVNSVT